MGAARLNGTVSKTVVALWDTIGSNQTFSAENKILVDAKAVIYNHLQALGTCGCIYYIR
jgi:hypothetical protein